MDDVTESSGLQVAAMVDPAERGEGTSAGADTEKEAAGEVVNEVKEHIGQKDKKLDKDEMDKDGTENQCASKDEESHKTTNEKANESADQITVTEDESKQNSNAATKSSTTETDTKLETKEDKEKEAKVPDLDVETLEPIWVKR